jgi:hypothetical protein
MSAEWCAETVEQAIALHGEPEIVNSDQRSASFANSTPATPASYFAKQMRSKTRRNCEYQKIVVNLHGQIFFQIEFIDRNSSKNL